MNSINFRMPARRWAVVAAATVLAAGPAALAGAGPAQATGEHGSASAAVLRTGLDVALLNKSVHAPLAVSLNAVEAPESAQKTTLTATLDGVHGGKPFSVLRAEVADARASVEGAKAEASTTLAKARVHVPGLPLLSLIELEKVTSKAVCEAGKTPLASATLPGSVTVLGKRVTLTSEGTTEVEVPGVGEVKLELSKTETTSRTAAATALRLQVAVNPAELNVAEVDGTVTLAEAKCEAPAAAEEEQEAAAPESEEKAAPAGQDAGDVQPQGARAKEAAADEANLAETGGDSTTPYIAGGAVALLAAGGAAVAISRRGRRT
ncbi:SCO1860 family LAETG-anchored protein [Streptomyces sp. SID14436]|uniref:LPXTG cell wall anchor domain-containing protein n=2 Tax=unclassified Streptomyces TaxID=2593676 RepID=A0A6G3R1S5_9ACTN|nr:SCO1860 family LAETG-anchored protein [Streptomyces sp. SID14436]NEA89380.1 LPXTG cell wall anchor domain-containing protein [Streptomyces sp. SID14436]